MDDRPLSIAQQAAPVNISCREKGVPLKRGARTLIAREKKRQPASGNVGASRQPERNRKLLIDATLDSIVENGITDTTVSRIIEKAGLSRGMIHLHFGGKDNLLVAAAEAFGIEYYDELERGVAGKRDDPAALIISVIRTDLGNALLNRRSVRIWHAFRGEASTNAGIARYSDTRDRRLRSMIRGAFEEIADSEGIDDNGLLARDANYGTLALLEGMWTDFLTHDAFSREVAFRIVCRFLAGLFPSQLQFEGSVSQ